MKLASFTDNSQSFVKYGDTNTFLHVQISEDGTFVDLTQATEIKVPIANDDGLLFTKTIDDPKTLANADSGIVDINFTEDDQDNMPPDDYYLEIWVINPDGTIGIYPADENQLSFTITDNLTLITGDVVPAVAFDDFQDMFDTLQQQVQDAISNGLKGDKGDTGTGLEIKGKVSSVSDLPSTANEGDGYLVDEELYVRINNAWKDCGPLRGPQGIQGVQGIQGKTGMGISSTTIQYQISNSATIAPTGIWSNNIVTTTTTNPYLWMKATLNYTNHTTKVFYLVSPKGDKGDTGLTGPVGPIGPRGPVGTGLVVKGTVKDASQLPKSGNQEGYCYFVGTDLYVWDAGAWKNCGSVSPDLSNYVTVTDLNNGLSTKVTDNKNGTEQLNGVKVQPYNKLSDVTNLRNIVLQTDNVPPYTAKGGRGEIIKSFSLYSGFSALPSGTQIYYSYDLVVTNADGGAHWLSWDSPWNTFSGDKSITTNGVHHYQGTAIILEKDIASGQNIISTIDKSHATYQLKNLMIVVGSIPVAHLPAPEDKVNVSDMRKPASDVAGIEEVNAKQDKIGYTPADDSKVVHDNHDGTVSINGNSFTPALLDSAIGKNAQPINTDVDTLAKPGLYYISKSAPNNPFKALMMLETKIQYDWNAFRGIQIAYELENKSGIAIRCINPNGDLTKPYPQTPWMFLSDDSKVAHLSGANNFDTVPTVNNNPLLLASSLPTDVARTGSDQEFTGKNAFDTAPIDKATGNPYITKDGVPAVPSTLADTTKDANFTGKLQKSGIDVATTTDVNKATTAANAYTDSKVKSSSDTGWQTFPLPIKNVNSSKYQTVHYRIINNVLYFSGNIKITSYSLNNSQVIGTIPDSIFNKLPTFSLNDSDDQRIQLPVSYYWFSGDAKNSLNMWINNSKQIKVIVSSTTYDDTGTGCIEMDGISIPLN